MFLSEFVNHQDSCLITDFIRRPFECGQGRCHDICKIAPKADAHYRAILRNIATPCSQCFDAPGSRQMAYRNDSRQFRILLKQIMRSLKTFFNTVQPDLSITAVQTIFVECKLISVERAHCGTDSGFAPRLWVSQQSNVLMS